MLLVRLVPVSPLPSLSLEALLNPTRALVLIITYWLVVSVGLSTFVVLSLAIRCVPFPSECMIARLNVLLNVGNCSRHVARM